MSHLKEIYRVHAELNADPSELLPMTESHKEQLDALENILDQLTGEGQEFSIELAGLDMAVGIQTETDMVMIPFTLRDQNDGSVQVQFDRNDRTPANFDLVKNAEPFVAFLASELPARAVRMQQVRHMVDYLSSKPQP